MVENNWLRDSNMPLWIDLEEDDLEELEPVASYEMYPLELEPPLLEVFQEYLVTEG